MVGYHQTLLNITTNNYVDAVCMGSNHKKVIDSDPSQVSRKFAILNSHSFLSTKIEIAYYKLERVTLNDLRTANLRPPQ